VDDLNATIPVSEWEEGIDGKPRAPWQHQWAVYLIDPEDGSTYTSCNSTWGQQSAYHELGNRIKVMRKLRGANVFPIVALGKATFPGKFGPKLRPEFAVLAWRQLGGDGGASQLPSAPIPQLEHQPTEPETGKEKAAKSAFAPKDMPGKKVKPVTYGEAMPGKPVKPVTVSEEIDDGLPDDLSAKKTA
jgi:hypothetical protein